MIQIFTKPPFETVVAENSKWLMRYIRRKIHNPSVAEDVLQDTFLSAFRNYDTYVENGKIQAWLMRIAANAVNKNFIGKNAVISTFMSFDDDENGLSDKLIDESDLPDDIVIRDETIRQIMDVINNLNQNEREIVYYRYIYDMSVEDVSVKLGIPKGTVKSRTHNTIMKIQKQMGVNLPITKGVHIMTCKELNKYLYNYAKGIISAENKALVEKHIVDCKVCADIVTALRNLVPHIVYGDDDVMTQYNINFNEASYLVIKSSTIIGKRNFGYNGNADILGIFDNTGKEIEFEDKVRVENDVTYHTVTYNNEDTCEVVIVYGGNKTYHKNEDSYYMCHGNSSDMPLYNSIYVAIPANADNIKIRRGNGVIDCGMYKFVFASRYTDADESVNLEASFTI